MKKIPNKYDLDMLSSNNYSYHQKIQFLNCSRGNFSLKKPWVNWHKWQIWRYNQYCYFWINALIIETIIILYFFYSVEMKIDCRHISANANPKTNVIQFLDSSHICFGFSNQLGVYSITEKKILFTIHGKQS